MNKKLDIMVGYGAQGWRVGTIYKNLLVSTDAFFEYQLLPELPLGDGIRYEYYDNIENKISTVGKINSLDPYVKIEFKKATYEYPFEEGVAVRLGGGYLFN